MSVSFSIPYHAFATYLFVTTLRLETGSLPIDGMQHQVIIKKLVKLFNKSVFKQFHYRNILPCTPSKHNDGNTTLRKYGNNDVIFLVVMLKNLERLIYDAL